MNVLITGAAGGIGSATAEYFLERGHNVHGLDIAPVPEALQNNSALQPQTEPAASASSIGVAASQSQSNAPASGTYTHHIADVRDTRSFPALAREEMPEILINCAGVQDSGHDIDVNLKGAINITEHYAIGNDRIRAVINVGSASAHTGSEFPEYAASKGGLISYTKNVALRLAPQATCNSIDPGGVLTDLNRCVIEDETLWNQIMELTPLKRWAEPVEIAEWIYFVGVTNRFMTGQNLLIDGGEAGNMNFIWPE